MSLLSYVELCDLVSNKVLTNVKPEAINSASIDLHLGNEILVERYDDYSSQIVDLSVKPRQSVQRSKVVIEDYYNLEPGEGILANTIEVFNLPDNIVGEYYLNSSLARNHLEHLHAGHMDPGWHGATLTLELINLNRFHTLRIRPGMRIGQALFYKVTLVPKDKSYSVIGSYNHQKTVQETK